MYFSTLPRHSSVKQTHAHLLNRCIIY